MKKDKNLILCSLVLISLVTKLFQRLAKQMTPLMKSYVDMFWYSRSFTCVTCITCDVCCVSRMRCEVWGVSCMRCDVCRVLGVTCDVCHVCNMWRVSRLWRVTCVTWHVWRVSRGVPGHLSPAQARGRTGWVRRETGERTVGLDTTSVPGLASSKSLPDIILQSGEIVTSFISHPRVDFPLWEIMTPFTILIQVKSIETSHQWYLLKVNQSDGMEKKRKMQFSRRHYLIVKKLNQAMDFRKTFLESETFESLLWLYHW